MTFNKWSKTAASNATADSTINWAEGQSPASVNDSGRAMMAAAAKYRDDVSGSITTGGTSTAYTVASNQSFASLSALSGNKVAFVPHATNGASATLNVDGLGAKPLWISSSVPIPVGFFTSNNIYTVTYFAAYDAFLVHGTPGALNAITTIGNASIGGNASITGNETIGGTLGVTGATTLAAVSATTGTFSGTLTQNSTSHGIIASGTTEQRPASPSAGSLRFNNTLGLLEFGDGSAWNQPSIAQPIAGGYRSLVIVNNSGTPNSMIDVDADAVTVETSSGVAYRLKNINLTINSLTSGANGLDTGTIAASTWYYIYVIYNPATTTVAGLISLSSTSPTLPSGYTAFARIGANKIDGSLAFYRVRQVGSLAQFVVTAGSNTASLPTMASGATGNIGTPTWTTVSTTSFVPITATSLRGVVACANTTAIIAPNVSYGANTSLTNPPPVIHSPPGSATFLFDMPLESSNIYWATNNSNAYLHCSGWVDNI